MCDSARSARDRGQDACVSVVRRVSDGGGRGIALLLELRGGHFLPPASAITTALAHSYTSSCPICLLSCPHHDWQGLLGGCSTRAFINAACGLLLGQRCGILL